MNDLAVGPFVLSFLSRDRAVPPEYNVHYPPRLFALHFVNPALRPLEFWCEPHPFALSALLRGRCPPIGEVLRLGLSTVCPLTTQERRVAV
jgi:hypothetical protein